MLMIVHVLTTRLYMYQGRATEPAISVAAARDTRAVHYVVRPRISDACCAWNSTALTSCWQHPLPVLCFQQLHPHGMRCRLLALQCLRRQSWKSFAMCLKLISICLSPYFHARGAAERVFIDLTIHQCHATSFTVCYTAYELYFL